MSLVAGTNHVAPRVTPVPRIANAPVATLARLAILAPPSFFTVMVVLGAVTPGYNAIGQMGSELSLGSLGWIMTANFLCLGLIEVLFSIRLFRAVGKTFSGRLGAAMVALAGAAFLDAGIFVTDPAGGPITTHGVLHVLAAVVLFFFAFPIGGLAMAWRTRRQHGFAAYSAVTAIATPLLLVATFTSGDVVGLMERVLIGVDLPWLAVLAWRIRRGDLFAPTSGGRSTIPPRAISPLQSGAPHRGIAYGGRTARRYEPPGGAIGASPLMLCSLPGKTADTEEK